MRHVYDYSSHTTNGSDNQADGDELLNTIGDVPRAWYRNEQHIGYGRSGVKLRGSDAIDGLDSLLRNIDDRSSWRQLFYDTSGQQLRLSSSQIALLQKLESGVLPSSGYVESSTQRSSFSQNQNQAAEPKRRFLLQDLRHEKCWRLFADCGSRFLVPNNQYQVLIRMN